MFLVLLHSRPSISVGKGNACDLAAWLGQMLPMLQQVNPSQDQEAEQS